MDSGLTGLVLTYNGERLLERCLESLSFCDRVLVVDSFSSDTTCALAERSGALIKQRRWDGPGNQFQFAFETIEQLHKNGSQTEWIISLDQDEICTPELRQSILDATVNTSTAIAGFWIPRRSWYYNRFLLHSGWYPDRLLRCFRRGQMDVHVSGAHYSFHPLGATQRLSGDILHYPYQNFQQHLDKINSYAQQGADSLAAHGVRGGVFQGILHGLGRFMRIYLFKRGFLDGRAGFINAVHGAFYAFLKYVRVNEGDWGYETITPSDGQHGEKSCQNSNTDACS